MFGIPGSTFSSQRGETNVMPRWLRLCSDFCPIYSPRTRVSETSSAHIAVSFGVTCLTGTIADRPRLNFNGRSSGNKGNRSTFTIDDSLFINHHLLDLALPQI